MPNGIEGFIHISELSDERVEKIEDILHVGQKTQFRVIRVSPEEHKIGLSLRSEPSQEELRHTERERASKKDIRAHAPVRKEETLTGAKPKSQLQLELERHAARLNETKDESGS